MQDLSKTVQNTVLTWIPVQQQQWAHSLSVETPRLMSFFHLSSMTNPSG
jgi:hypothetical protein